MNNLALWVIIIVAVLLVLRVVARLRQTQQQQERGENDEALFQAMFPELQPWYHPERMVEFAIARLARPESGLTWQWPRPPGFTGAEQADCAPDPKGERIRMLDAAGTRLAEFVYNTHPEGAVIRVANGKLTVDLRDRANPRVRYWHPQREFKWSRQGWVFKTPVADEPFSSSDSSSSSASSAASNATSDLAGRDGAFGGGGATGAWDAARGSQAGTVAAAAAAAATVAVVAGVAAAGGDNSASAPDDAGGTSY